MILSCCSMSSSPEASIETARPSLAEFCCFQSANVRMTWKILSAYLDVVHLACESHADRRCHNLLQQASDLALTVDLCAENGP